MYTKTDTYLQIEGYTALTAKFAIMKGRQCSIVPRHMSCLLLVLLMSSWSSFVSSCPTGWTSFNDVKCFKYLALNVNYGEAETVCRNSNSTLASIHSREEQDFVLGLARIYSSLSGVHWVWLGATRNNSANNNFSWKDGSSLNFTNWRDGCPDNRMDEDCVLMTVFRDRPGHWCNFKCTTNYDHVLCQKPKGKDDNSTSTSPFNYPPRSFGLSGPWTSIGRPRIQFASIPAILPPRYRTSTPAEVDECDIGWDFKNNKCYKFISDNVTGEEARYYCKRYGTNAKPLTIHSESEQTWAVDFSFFKNEAKEAVWIGAFRSGPDLSNITWRDGSPMDYTNWAAHEPDNRNKSENCVALNDMPKFYGRWLDAPCSLKFHLICEKPANIPFTSTTISSALLNRPWSDNLQTSDSDVSSQSLPESSSSSSSGFVTFLVFLTITLGILVVALFAKLKNQQKTLSRDLHGSRRAIYSSGSEADYEDTMPYSATTVPNFPTSSITFETPATAN